MEQFLAEDPPWGGLSSHLVGDFFSDKKWCLLNYRVKQNEEIEFNKLDKYKKITRYVYIYILMVCIWWFPES